MRDYLSCPGHADDDNYPAAIFSARWNAGRATQRAM
jgi:hypothetical protein